ncbi:MAG TPA: hypothetical protein VFJ82_18365 [Longimicrobium sp.]|nr:hypothetical protein [Longimicrobium sp.]
MSLLAFQRALAALAASPELCRRVRTGDPAALSAYELTPLEHRRLVSAAGQPGMAVNCTLHRSNRISSILNLLPGTIHLLGKELRPVADRFWARHPNPDFTTRREVRRFCGWLMDEARAGRIASPFLADVTGWELAQYELRMVSRKRTLARVADDAERWPDGPLAVHPLVRVAAFRHDPDVLLPLVARKAPPPWDDVPTGEFYRLADVREPARVVAPLDVPAGRALLAIERGEPVPEDQRDALLAARLLVRIAPASADATEPTPELAAAV